MADGMAAVKQRSNGRGTAWGHPVVALAAVLFCCIAWAGASVAENAPAAKYPQQTAIGAVTQARRLIAAGRPAEAYALLRRAMAAASSGGADTAPIRYTAAQALIAGGHYAQAAEFLRRLAEDRPEIDRVRLDYAAVLFTLGRDDESDAVFRDIRRKESLSPETRRRVEGYLERIRSRQRWNLDFDIGFWHDDNVNNASEREKVAIPAFGGLRFTLDQQPVRAWVARTGTRLRWRKPVTEDGQALFETHASVARNTALGATEYNRTWASLSTGPRLHYALPVEGRPRPGLMRADVGVERRWRGGDPYAGGLWAGLGAEQAISRDWRIGVLSRVWITRYDEGEQDAEPWGRSLDLHVSRRVGPGWLTAGGKISRETAVLRRLRLRSREASLRYAADIGRDWNASVRLGLAETQFDAEEPLFLKRRGDRTREIGLTVSHRGLSWEGYLPELTVNWSRTDSSIPLYDRDLRTLRLGLRRLF